MTSCPDLKPDPHNYQQLEPWTPTGYADCTAWSGAAAAFVHSCGAVRITGRSVRLNTNEPTPDPGSPGLNLPQVDSAIYRMTGGRVNLDVHAWGGNNPPISHAALQSALLAGKWSVLQVIRGVLVDGGWGGGNGFRGSHAVLIGAPGGTLRMLDPLVKVYLLPSWSLVFRAASALAGTGVCYAALTRDVNPSSYYVTIDPNERFRSYKVTNGVVVGRTWHAASSHVRKRACTRRASYPYPAFGVRKTLARLLGTGPVARSDYPYVSTEASAIRYTEVLP